MPAAITRQKPTLPPRYPGESHLDYQRRLDLWSREIRSKGDLREWTTCTFSLSNEKQAKR